MNQIIQNIESKYLKKHVPQLNVGDSVKVFVKIKEGNKERTQGYEGVIIKRHGCGTSATVTVRRVFQGIGIERVFFVHSPRVEKITIQRLGHVRRAKLYYLRERTGKATRIKQKAGSGQDLAAANQVPVEVITPAEAVSAEVSSEIEEANTKAVTETSTPEAPAADLSKEE